VQAVATLGIYVAIADWLGVGSCWGKIVINSESPVRVWINVTTSANWSRPAVGIIRVERALAEHLQTQLGKNTCRLCVWKDDRFVEWTPDSEFSSPDMEHALNMLLPRSPSFDLARSHVARALQRFLTISDESERAGELRFKLPFKDNELPHPLPGEILISAGLDWDYAYSKEFYSLAKRQGLRIITCCYDLIPVLFPQYCVGDVAKTYTEYFMSMNWGSEAILCISEHTRQDYLSLCADLGAPLRKAIVIPLGDNLPASSPDVGNQVRSIAESPFILYVSTIERRKNHEVLYRAYHLLLRRGSASDLPTLVFVGMPGWGIAELLQDIELDPLIRGKIVQLNHVSDGELAFLYKKSLFCVFPSLYEGWGLPVGEALSMGKAVIASGEASIPEVGGDLVRYVHPWDAYEWADAIDEYVKNPSLVQKAESRIRAGYVPRKWADTAAVVRDLVGEMIGGADRTTGSLVFLPGYDLQTECGIHHGPDILTNGTGGVLLKGPHISLRGGKYRLQIMGNALAQNGGALTIEVVSDKGKTVHFRNRFDVGEATENALVDCNFELPKSVIDIEFRCLIDSSCSIQLGSIRLESTNG
jgi:glycosyltransferase involved in cell wall biosynthesis